MIEHATDSDRGDVRRRLAEIQDEVLKLFKADNPEYVERLDGLLKCHSVVRLPATQAFARI